MKKLITTTIVTLIILVLVAGCSGSGATASAAGQTVLQTSVSPSGAAAGFEVYGTFERGTAPSGSTPYKGETYYVFYGDLEGQFVTATAVESSMVDGSTVAPAKGTFTGTVNGVEGTFEFREVYSCQVYSSNAIGIMCQYNIVSGFRELRDFNGVINTSEFTTPDGLSGIYSGILSFGEDVGG